MRNLCLLLAFSFACLFSFAVPSIYYNALTSSCATGDRIISSVTIYESAGVPLSGDLVPRIYFRKASSPTWFSRPGTLTDGTATSSTWSFTIAAADMGGLSENDIVQYYVIAQSAAATPTIASRPAGAVASNVLTVTTPPSTPYSFTVGGTLNGTYTVGVGGNFPTLSAAINAYNAGCLAGPVVFSLTDASYTQTTSLIINAHP